MHSYATYFDSNYLPRALSLFESLRVNGDENDIFALLLDEVAEKYFEEHDVEVKTISLGQLEDRFPELLTAKSHRSKMEYIFTITPWLLKYVAEASKNELVIYLDADLHFFDDPGLVVADMGNADVGIIEHKYPKILQGSLAKYGKYNVGWVGIRKNANGLTCLDWWAAKCLEWCLDRPEPGRYADQGYLDAFPIKFEGVKVLQSTGFNLAPWNSQNVKIRPHGGSLINSQSSEKVVFFHFHGLKTLGQWFVTSHLNYLGFTSKSLIQNVYVPYVRTLLKYEAVVIHAGIVVGSTNRRGTGIRSGLMRAQRLIFALLSIMTGNAFKLENYSDRDSSVR